MLKKLALLLVAVAVWFAATLLAGLHSFSFGNPVLLATVQAVLVAWLGAEIAMAVLRGGFNRHVLEVQIVACLLGGMLFRAVDPAMESTIIGGSSKWVFILSGAFSDSGPTVGLWSFAWGVAVPVAAVILADRRMRRAHRAAHSEAA